MYIYMFCQGLFNNNFICTLLTLLSNKRILLRFVVLKHFVYLVFCLYGYLFTILLKFKYLDSVH